jgi:hypothetical protein
MGCSSGTLKIAKVFIRIGRLVLLVSLSEMELQGALNKNEV